MKRIRGFNRRGATIELAIVALLLIFAVCTMITEVCLVSRAKNREAVSDLKYQIEAKALGEMFYSTVCDQLGGFNYANAQIFYPDLVITTDYAPGKETVSLVVEQTKNKGISYQKHLLTVNIEVEFTETEQVTRIVNWSYTALPEVTFSY